MAIPHTADIFQAKSESLATLLPDIHGHKAALPNFQREWVWEPSMVKDLIISVANRYPAGSLLTMPNSGDTFALRPFSGSGSELKTTPTLMVLDGQQRLTSLYQALYSKNGIKDAKGGTHFLYLDIEKLTEHETEESQQEATFADCIFTVPVNRYGQLLRYAGLRDYVDLSTADLEIKEGMLPLHSVFNPDDLVTWRDRYIQERANRDYDRLMELREEWDQEVSPWITRIRDCRFPVIELNRDMELHAICHIFEKVNSTGVPLSVFELCTAILWAQGLRLNDQWHDTRRSLEKDQVLRMQGPLEGAMFLQVISLLLTLKRKRESTEGRVAVNCRREDLLNLKADTVNEWWDVATVAYRDASKFMESQGIIAQRVLPYTTLLIPLAAIMGFLKYQDGKAQFGHAWPKIEQWYWCSVFSQRYSSSVEASAAVDFEQVINWIGGGDEPEAVRTFSFSADRLQDYNNIRSAIYKGILCLLAKSGANDFGGEGTLSVNLYYDSQQDHHHIFPVNALSNLGIDDWRMNSIVNKTLIGASSNRSIGGRLPSAYVETMKSRLGEERTNTILRSHLVSPETLQSDDWEDFFLSRREELKQLIHTTCGGQMQDFADGKRVSLPLQIQRLSDDVSDIERRLRRVIAATTNDDWSIVPDHIRVKADDRINAVIRENPGVDRSSFESVIGHLAYCDLREMEQIIVSKSLWPTFADVFGTKETVSIRFRQLAPLRNANAHLRDVDELVRSDAEAAAIWFKGAMARAESMNDAESVNLPMEEIPDSDFEAVPVERS
ncbi:MAG: GmrSD restriction endonuclease domain-containing protein [Thermomicrobiales bacterium]